MPTEYPHLSSERIRKEKVLKPILEKLKAREVEEAMKLFSELPKFDQQKVFETTWELKQCPIRTNFGEGSFLRLKGLESHEYCNDQERSHVLTEYLHQ